MSEKTSEKQTVKKYGIKNFLMDAATILVAAVLSAIGFHVFVYPAKFAPGGMDGITTILQEKTGLSAGWYSLFLNTPLLIVAYFILKKRYVICTISFTILNALFLIILEKINFYQYDAESERLLAAIFSGIILGARIGMLLKMGASSGGVDVIGCIVEKYKPHINAERIIAIISYLVIAISYFVYRDLDSLLLAVVEMFIYERMAGAFMKDSRNAVEFKIITKHPEEIRSEILYSLKHGATVVESKGMFTESGSSIIFCVVNLRQISDFLNILKKYPDTFVYYTQVSGVSGNFRRKKDDEAK